MAQPASIDMTSSAPRQPFTNHAMNASRPCGPLQPSSMSNLNAAAGRLASNEPIMIQITQAEHDVLIEMSRRYTNLRSNLITLGADLDVIEKFSHETSVTQANESSSGSVKLSLHTTAGDDHPTSHGIKCAASNVAFPRKLTPVTPKLMSAKANVFYPTGLQTRVSTWMDDEDEDLGYTGDSIANHESPIAHTRSNAEVDIEDLPRTPIARHAKRSLRLDNLTIATGISDIAAAIRGGQLLEIYQRYKEKAAIVSFVHEHEAQAFYDHVRKNDLYIKSKRIEVSWNDFQKSIPGHLVGSIRGGATRNLIVRQCDSYQTPEGIKDDLEHIHDLRVLSVEFRGRDCLIKTNSIAGAVFARSCMRSRHRYRRCRMEWAVDECTEPLTDRPEKFLRPVASPAAKAAKPVNRYKMLSLDRDA
ncbi:hypothetical protein NLU13_6970 [Sarocladium strictum]|uniref:Uncharacterized protein n=1 Tax=Sarocladium strictum TaxID=5046 RepID=A0AA39GED5_SARSR|nr:hypothetical protein NLU13_6970 [Sarocladium strictum]